jgi:hypothetical protein
MDFVNMIMDNSEWILVRLAAGGFSWLRTGAGGGLL